MLRAVLLLVRRPRRRCCATAAVLRSLCCAHHVCVCFVFSGCAVSRWSWELCMHQQKSTYQGSSAVWSHLYYTFVPHFTNTQGWDFEVFSPNNNERQVSPPSPLLLMLLLWLYCFCCAMLLLCCYSHHLGLRCVPTAHIYHSCSCGTSCSPRNIRT